ncbi:Gfo/Idh/MocA family protein [Microbacterium ulmi]|uniref:Gfo/Idh/MocA family oxidoreductase n=1 Tax=Microbacterium ulmi TaxID=179095 RepID=A0A7Y2LZQ9_9MICO|nr:Gfo/Idh/MocA family oxidoreductase [Microbacterium ulmi]NII69926.1 putative dehydrogenase [Microbacterium ulmi]NNH03846.1 Gfo/Idh/MocA family oxidoreductase [Microbacterium ulmi]
MGQPLVNDSADRLRIGIVGVGAISGAYLRTFRRLDAVRLVAVADLDRDRARAVAGDEGVRALSVDDLVTDPDVDLVLNLTIPAAHAEIGMRALAAGKHLYGEKPLTATMAQARGLLDAAADAGVHAGCAPDTVLGTGIQTSRRAIDDGLIGRPIAATATMVTPGHERWHPNPDFYYQPGGGPVLDMGPYYVTALVTLLGPVESVMASASRTRVTRVIGSGPRAGSVVPVDVDTHVTGVLRHASGALSTLVMSFDAVATRASSIEVHGESGSLAVPDPNGFDGDVRIHRLGGEWETLPPSAGYRDAARGFGVADLALTPPGALPRASAELAFHVLEVMTSLHAAADAGTTLPILSAPARPAPVPLGDAPGGLRG